MRLAPSSNRPAPTVTRCTPPTFWFSCSAFAAVRSWTLPGTTFTLTPPRSRSPGSCSDPAANSVTARPRHQGSEAILPLPDICVTALKLRAEGQARDRAAIGDAWQDTPLVFATTLGTPYEPRNFARPFVLRSEKAGVRYIKVHDTRRTCGSLLAALDVHPRTVMQILRHSKIAITMEIYTEVPEARTREALRALGSQLDR